MRLIIVETDGCFVDGIEVSTGVTVGHRSLRVVDLGKIAATFVSLANWPGPPAGSTGGNPRSWRAPLRRRQPSVTLRSFRVMR